MKKFWFTLAVLGTLLLNAPHAVALSTTQSTEQNSDGTPKFADPDEKTPNFVVSPSTSGARNGSLSFSSSNVTVPAVGDNDNGAKAFDQAFDHQQSK